MVIINRTTRMPQQGAKQYKIIRSVKKGFISIFYREMNMIIMIRWCFGRKININLISVSDRWRWMWLASAMILQLIWKWRHTPWTMMQFISFGPFTGLKFLVYNRDFPSILLFNSDFHQLIEKEISYHR